MFTQETCLIGFKEQKIYRSSSSEVFLKLLENSETLTGNTCDGDCLYKKEVLS